VPPTLSSPAKVDAMFLEMAFDACARNTGIARDDAVHLWEAASGSSFSTLHRHIGQQHSYPRCTDAELSQAGGAKASFAPGDCPERYPSADCHAVKRTARDDMCRDRSAWASDRGCEREDFQNDIEELVGASISQPQHQHNPTTTVAELRLDDRLLLEEQVVQAVRSARSKAKAAERHVRLQRLRASGSAEATFREIV